MDEKLNLYGGFRTIMIPVFIAILEHLNRVLEVYVQRL